MHTGTMYILYFYGYTTHMYWVNTIKHTTRTAIDAILRVITSLSCTQLSVMASLKKCITFDRERMLLLNLYLKGKIR